jgi:hypothetical protein
VVKEGANPPSVYGEFSIEKGFERWLGFNRKIVLGAGVGRR